MKKWKIAVLVLIVVSLSANLGWWQAWQDWQEREALTLFQLANSKSEFDGVKKELAEKQLEFIKFRLEKEDELRELDSGLKDAKTQLDNAVAHMFLLTNELQGVRREPASQKTYYEQMIDLSKEVGYRAALAAEVTLRDPTYKELRNFLTQNKVNLRTWTPGKYVCVDFAADLNNDAEAAGFRSAYVWLVGGYSSDGSKWGHLLNGFQTLDKGLIFIEPQSDAEADIKVGSYYPYVSSTIKEIIIVW